MDVERVHVFLDWQNIYMRAREAFHNPAHSPHSDGQVSPIDLALVLAERGNGDRERKLERVHIYRGIPDQQYDVKGYAAARRQLAAWAKNQLIEVHTRPLRYPEDWVKDGGPEQERPREKGIDVALAVDVVIGAADRLYDTAIVMSADTDLVPALEYVERLQRRDAHAPRVEVAMWKGNYGRRASRISTSRGRPFCHWLLQEDYWGLQDRTDYAEPTNGPAGGPKPGQWFGRR